MNLVPRFILGDLDLTDYPYSVARDDTTQFGSAENITEVLNSLLTDGELLSSTRVSNREMTLSIVVEGTDMIALAEAEALLVREASKPSNTLTIDPGDGIGVPTVFDTFRAGVNFDRRDAHESALMRRFVLTIPALPYGRSESLTTEVAEGIPSVGTVVADGTSLTGWSTPASTLSPAPTAMLAVVGGRIAVQPYTGTVSAVQNDAGTFSRYLYSATRTLSQPIPAGAYVSIEVELESPYVVPWVDQGDDGTRLTQITMSTTDGGVIVPIESCIIQAIGPRRARYTWKVDQATTLAAVTASTAQYRPSSQHAAPYPNLFLDNLAVAESAALGTQVLKTFDVGGSARTVGALHVAAPSDAVALGRVLAFTVPQRLVPVGWKPDLRQWATTGTTTADASAPNGSFYSAIHDSDFGQAGAPVFEAPASQFAAGAYTLAALLKTRGGVAAGTFTVEASLIVDGTVVATEVVESVLGGEESDDPEWRLHILDATAYLPPTPIQMPTADAVVRFRFIASSSPGLGELYALPTTGRMTIVDAQESSHLWIESPSPEWPQGSYWRGSSADRANALAAWSTTDVPGVHIYEAGQMLAFVSAEAQGPSVTFDHFKRWLAHAPE